MKCPYCGHQINVGSLLGSVKSEAKAAAARLNAQKPRGPRKKKDANEPKTGSAAKPTLSIIIFQEPDGLFYWDYRDKRPDYLDARGKGYPSRAAARRAAKEEMERLKALQREAPAKQKVITYQSSRGSRIHLTRRQADMLGRIDPVFKEYWLRVPPEITTARAAVAWTFEQTPEEYELALQT